MVTAYGDEERRRRASEFDATDFITKPVDFLFPESEAAPVAGATRARDLQ
jgi:CheY-like chemotaxis protein